MSRRNWMQFGTALLLIAGTAFFLNHLRAFQKLGPPGVRTHKLNKEWPADGTNLVVDLPEFVLNYDSEPVEITKLVLDTLPRDTSFGQRLYRIPEVPGSEALANVVLMGADRTSLHKPEFCLEGQGWRINRSASEEISVRIERPQPYDLPMTKYLVRRGDASGVYLFWFVAEKEMTASANQRMWWMARDLLRTGVLQRWAYISYFAVCEPGKEEATLERLKRLIASSVPQFQLTPRPESATASVSP